jgi:hypothetical protein
MRDPKTLVILGINPTYTQVSVNGPGTQRIISAIQKYVLDSGLNPE